MRNEKGFTLIEIIAVLVILGILAAVAIPKYFDMQGQARTKAAEGALAALQSTATQAYAEGLLNGSYNATSGPTTNTTVNVGDFGGGYSVATGGIASVNITSGPNGYSDGVPATSLGKQFKMHD